MADTLVMIAFAGDNPKFQPVPDCRYLPELQPTEYCAWLQATRHTSLGGILS